MSKTFIAMVGEWEEEFTLHTDVACRSSKFFQTALDRDWKESQTNTVVLHDVKAAHFESYLQWLSTNDHSFLEEYDLVELAKLYILGDFLDDSDFRVAMLRSLAKRAIERNTRPRRKAVESIWDQTPENSPLRKMILERWATLPIESLAERFAEAGKSFPMNSIVDCLRRIGELTTVPKEGVTGEDRRRLLQFRRDTIIGELLGGQQSIVLEDDGLAEV